MQRDTVTGTFLVATVLCVACSLLVAGTAEGLRGGIAKNEELDRYKNILLVAGLAGEDVDAVYQENIEEVWVDLQTGETIPEEDLPDGYDPDKAAKDPSQQVAVKDDGLMGIRYREPIAPVYKLKSGGFVLPVYGKGLWGGLWGFLALEADAKTVKGITFYKHKETPGLGAEIADSETWKGYWPGKEAISESGEVQIQVVKGGAPAGSPAEDYTIDAVSGATITSKGVDHLAKYWLGEEGFGKYLAKQ